MFLMYCEIFELDLNFFENDKNVLESKLVIIAAPTISDYPCGIKQVY